MEPTLFDKPNSLEEARIYVDRNASKGVICPCCSQYVRTYNRKMNSGMSIVLIYLYLTGRNDWIQVKQFLLSMKYKNNHDWTLLKYWGLLEQKEKSPEDSDKLKYLGYWKVTEKGRLFVKNTITVRERIVLRNNDFKGYDGGYISIIDSLGKHFNYSELMSTVVW